jgi:FMN phosphatase YigB (HAD superfamily)
MRFIFDCDDVLLDWNGAFLTWLKGRGFRPDPAGPKDWDLSGWIRCTPEEARDLIERFNNSEHFEFIPARPGAKSSVWALHDAGHKISVLTSCGTRARLRESRWRNLYREFARDSAGAPWTIASVNMIPLGASKEPALYEMCDRYHPSNLVFVEDNLKHAMTGAALGITSFCLRRSHNRALEAKGEGVGVVHWVDDIKDIMGVYA